MPQRSAEVDPNGMHTSPTQQPSQLPGPQKAVGWQVRAPGRPSWVQVSSNWQAVQAWPRRPQALSLKPDWQLPAASQQPPQLAGPHFGVDSQRPPPMLVIRQTSPVLQRPHWPPFSPQANWELPGRHKSPTQQPLQFEASQRVVPQVRVERSQARPSSSQFAHVLPLLPHAVASVPDRHCAVPPPVSMQHPLGQFDGPQLVTVFAQTRASVQVSKPSVTQSLHAPPPAPHERVLRPVWHWPAASQHPFEHVAGPQAGGLPLLDELEVKLASRSSGSRLERPQPAARTMKRAMLRVETNR